MCAARAGRPRRWAAAPPFARVSRRGRGRSGSAGEGGGEGRPRAPLPRAPAAPPVPPHPGVCCPGSPRPAAAASGSPRPRPSRVSSFPSPPPTFPRRPHRAAPSPLHARHPASRRRPSPCVARGLGRAGVGQTGRGAVGGVRGRGVCVCCGGGWKARRRERGPPHGGGPVASRLGPAGAGAVGVGRVWWRRRWRRRRLVAVSGRGSRSPPPVPRPVRSLSLPPFQVPSASRRGGLKTPRGPPVRPGSGAVGPLGGGGKCGEGWAGPAPAHLSHPSPRGLRLPRPRGGGRWEPPGRLWGVLLGGRPSGNHPVVKPSPTRPSLFLSAAGRPEAP